MPPQKWGRKEATLWPRRGMIRTTGAFALSLVLCAGMIYFRCAVGLSSLQRFYLPVLLRTEVTAQLVQNGTYRLLIISDNKSRSRVALEDDLAPGITQVAPDQSVPFVPSPAAQNNGLTRLFLEPKRVYRNGPLHDYLKCWIYGQRSLSELFGPALLGSLGIFILSLCYAIPHDLKHRRELRYGRRLRGPELLDAKEFNRRLRSDGVGFEIVDPRGRIAIPRRLENSHMLVIGDNGSGKSSLIRQVLLQVQQRGEGAIVYDPALEYITEFYNQHRGDVILNPLDARMPFWNPSAELKHPSEAYAIAESLFPQEDYQNKFFVNGPRKIFAHLLRYRPNPEEIASWMCNPEEIDLRVRGTELAAMIQSAAANQRGGLLGSLNMVGDAFKSLPKVNETKTHWTATDWARDREGWIFVTSKPIDRAKLLPLMSLWLDMLVLRLMSEDCNSARRVWFVLDELASLQRLPQLHTAVTENRKTRNPLILGFHGRSQLEDNYGRKAEAMLSQPATKIFLHTSEVGAADWISQMLGEVEIERLRESHHQGNRHGRNFSLEQKLERLVLPSEVSGLKDMRGFLKLENYVVRVEFPYVELPKIAEKFVPRNTDDDWLTLDSPQSLDLPARESGAKFPSTDAQRDITL